MKKITLIFALAVGLLTSASTLHAQTVNMSRYITLTVKKDSAIKLDFKAAAYGTPIRIVSGSNTQDITVNTSWYNGNWPSTYTVTADASTMTVYGDLMVFDCSKNGTNLTALDLSENTQLKDLSCLYNKLTTLDVSQNTQLTELECSYNKLTTLDVSQNTQLTELKCSSNKLTTLDLSENTQLKDLSCSSNQLTTLDVSQNTQLKDLSCSYNQLTTLDVSQNTQLKELDCLYNQLTTLDVSQNTQLTELDCSDNKLSSLDISKNTLLDKLYCIGNNLSSLDVSNNTQLKRLYCFANYLTSLNVSNTQLELLYCYSNNFSTQALDDIYCALPDRTGKANGAIQPVYSDTSSNHAIVLATNKANAIAKNWKVQYYKNDADIPVTTGKHKCPATDIAEATAEQALTLYPNPVADVLYLSATARTIRVYDIYGTEVAHATDTDRVEVSHLPAGVYTVRADGTVAKMVKR